MRDRIIVYRLTNTEHEFEGTAEELAKEFGDCIIKSIPRAYGRNKRYHGYDVERIGIYRKVYDVYEHDKHTFSGYVEEVAKKFNLTEIRVMQVAKNNILVRNKYRIEQFKYEFVYI